MAVNRRGFLSNAVGAGIVSTGIFIPWQPWLRAAAKTQSDFDDYKALVYVLFGGGMDSFNLLVPYDDNEYDRYADVRSDLKYSREELLELDSSETDRRFSVPSMAPELRELFNDGDLAFLANVGPLTRHMNREQYLDDTLLKPLNLESHSDQIAQWQSTDALRPLSKQTVGWLGRVSDCFGSTLDNGLSMNVSMSGFNLAQTGEEAIPILTPHTSGRDPFEELIEDHNDAKKTANEDFEFGRFDNSYDNLLQNEYLQRFKRSIEDTRKANRDFRSLGGGSVNTSFVPSDRSNPTPFGNSMKRTAEFINAHPDFGGGGAHRQTFFVSYNASWDHHEDLHTNFYRNMKDVSFVLKAFRDALVENDMLDNVVLFTASDFGRTLTSNGGGSDHGWGGNAMILGGPVNGKHVLGQYPEMDLEGDQVSNATRGNFIPTTSLEEYYAELALWFGLDEEDLNIVLPNVDSFIPEDATKPESLGIIESETETES